MSLDKIIDTSEFFTDETVGEDSLLLAANKCIARLNTTCGARFPMFNTVSEDYSSFPASWQLELLGNYLSWSIKMNDGSLDEADRFLRDFNTSLELFKSSLMKMINLYNAGDTENGISGSLFDADGFGGKYTIDTTSAIDDDLFYYGNGGSY